MRWRRTADTDTDESAAAQADRPEVPVDLGVVDAHALTRATRRVVARALTEDLDGQHDLTSALTVPVGTTGRALLVAREEGVLAGLDLLREVCSQVDHRLVVHLKHFDGDHVARGAVIAEVTGPLRTLLTAERTALNLVCHLSGVATRTRAFAEVLEGTDCVVRDTRKTTPGLRLLEKHAVACGGGANHRIGLYDAVLVKDNHVAAAGSIEAAARAALEGAPEGVHVQVEVTSLAQAEDAMAVGVTDLLLDNFTPDEVREAVAAIDGRAAVEASGGITLATARAFAEAGADRLAVGALTHSAPSLDLALDVVDVTVPQRGPVNEPLFDTAVREHSTTADLDDDVLDEGDVDNEDLDGDGDHEDLDEGDVAATEAEPAAEEPTSEEPTSEEAEREEPASEEPERDERPRVPPPPPTSERPRTTAPPPPPTVEPVAVDAVREDLVPDPPDRAEERVDGYDPTEALFDRSAGRSDG